MLCRNLPDMGPQPSKSTPEAAQPGIGQAGNPQHDMKVPPADTIIDAHAESAAQEEPRTCLTLSTYVIYTSQVAWGPPLATLTKTPRSLPVAEPDTEGMPGKLCVHMLTWLCYIICRTTCRGEQDAEDA